MEYAGRSSEVWKVPELLFQLTDAQETTRDSQLGLDSNVQSAEGQGAERHKGHQCPMEE